MRAYIIIIHTIILYHVCMCSYFKISTKNSLCWLHFYNAHRPTQCNYQLLKRNLTRLSIYDCNLYNYLAAF